MATHLDDEEQVENVKRWLRENGAALVAGLVIGLGAIGGWEAWQRWEEGSARAATALYEQLQQAADADEDEQVAALAAELVDEYASSPYATAAQLLIARQAVDDARYEDATAPLQWVAEHADDDAYRQLAQLRLARVLWQLERTDEAIDALPMEGPYAALAQELRGDIALSRGDADGARVAYRAALEQSDPAAPTRESVRQKLDDLAVDVAQGEAS